MKMNENTVFKLMYIYLEWDRAHPPITALGAPVPLGLVVHIALAL